MQLGNTILPKAAMLAPMAGVGDRAFREICVQQGAVYAVTEMASAKGLVLSGKKTAQLLQLSAEERPAGIQLFGDDPAIMAKATAIALEYNPQSIDINMGCPAPKIVGGGGGSALMKNLPLAGEIVAKVVQAAGAVPVTVKMRTGWDDTSLTALQLAQICQAAGAAALAIHGRTRMQMYAPPVNYAMIKAVKDAVHIPVIANGDVQDAKSAAAMYAATGCDLIMVGRGALGAPWVFGQIAHYMATGQELPPPSPQQRMEIFCQHIALACAYKGEGIAMREARKHAACYLKGLHGAAELRRIACSLSSLQDLTALVSQALAKGWPTEDEPSL